MLCGNFNINFFQKSKLFSVRLLFSTLRVECPLSIQWEVFTQLWADIFMNGLPWNFYERRASHSQMKTSYNKICDSLSNRFKSLHRDVKYSMRRQNRTKQTVKRKKHEKLLSFHKKINETIEKRYLEFGVLSTFHLLCTFLCPFISFPFPSRIMSRANDIGNASHTAAPNWN